MAHTCSSGAIERFYPVPNNISVLTYLKKKTLARTIGISEHTIYPRTFDMQTNDAGWLIHHDRSKPNSEGDKI